jgi:hypothetical protein
LVFIDTGMRLGESAGLDYAEDESANVDFDYDVLHVTAKGGRRRAAPFGVKTGLALERYLRKRNEILRASRLPLDGPLWIGALRKDRLTGSGERECAFLGLAFVANGRLDLVRRPGGSPRAGLAGFCCTARGAGGDDVAEPDHGFGPARHQGSRTPDSIERWDPEIVPSTSALGASQRVRIR